MPVLRFLQSLLAACLLCGAPLAMAGITYQIESPKDGGPVVITGILFNDTNSALPWQPAQTLALTWQTPDGRTVQGEARLVSSADAIELPVNNFAALRWETERPAQLHGLLALRVQDQETLLALNAPSSAPGSSAQPLGDVAQAAPEYAVQEPAGSVSAGGAQASAKTPSAFDNFRNAISTHDPIYFAVGGADGTHARFQVSFKYRLFSPESEDDPHFIDHFYLGYTQTSLWDLDGRSKPFIDTTYNPSLFWRQDKLLASEQERAFLGLAAGVEHKSNGKGGGDSRSLNNLFIQPEFNYRFGDGSTLTFAPRVKSYFSISDNRDYADYAGHVDWQLRWAQDQGLVLGGLYRQGKYGRNTWQLDAAWPLRRTPLNMNGYLYVQYFKGYGDTLLGYDQKSSPRVRVGLALVP